MKILGKHMIYSKQTKKINALLYTEFFVTKTRQI